MTCLPIDFRLKKNVISPLQIVCVALLLMAMTFIVLSNSYTKIYIVGSSMSDTLTGARDVYHSGGDYVYIYKKTTPERGDIVVVSTSSKVIIKRIIALGGDTVELREGVLYLNGKQKAEPYVNPDHNKPSYEYNTFPKVTVPSGYMFCLGDNRNDSIDSRDEKYGFLPVSDVVGVVADWSLSLKPLTTAFNSFFEFTLPAAFGMRN